MESPESDEKRRDEILKRMLKTPPKPHKPQQAGKDAKEHPIASKDKAE